MPLSLKRVGSFVGVGALLTLIDYGIYECLICMLLKNLESGASIATIISGFLSTLIGFFLHSKITWKDRSVNKVNMVRFFAWNLTVMALLRPLLLRAVSSADFLDDIIMLLLGWTGLGNVFLVSTCTYGIVTVITLILNFIFYDKFVFGNKNAEPSI